MKIFIKTYKISIIFLVLIVFFSNVSIVFGAPDVELEVSEGFNASDDVDVIILLKDADSQQVSDRNLIVKTKVEPTEWALMQRKAMISTKQDSVLFALSLSDQNSHPDFKLKYKYSVVNALSGKLTKNGLEKLRQNNDVKGIFLDKKVYASLDESVPLINADDVWGVRINGRNITGAGQTACIIDTGVDYTHSNLGGCFGAGCKVIGGYDFVNTDPDPMDDNGHGTHCAGIIASTHSVYRGVAPDADIVAIKVLNNQGYGKESDVIAGIDWCVSNASKFNISVISMSLGDQRHNPTYCNNDPSAVAINAAVEQGILVVVASGNDGSIIGISTPACVENATSVGSSYVSSSYSALYSELFVVSDGNNKIDSRPMEYSANATVAGDLLYADLGYPANFTGQNFTGKIALIKRGILYFYEKVQNAYNAGAIGAIIFNNQPGIFYGNLTNASEIPAVSISLEDGEYLRSLPNGTVVNMSVISFTGNERVSSFTNRNEFLDLLAPGEGIISTKKGGSFTSMSGTSMATPHVAGAVLVLRQYQKERNLNLTPKQIENALKNTGVKVYDPETGLVFPRIDVLGAINSMEGVFTTEEMINTTQGVGIISVSLLTTAEKFLAETNCTFISRYDGGIQTHIKGSPFFDFNITPARGYYTYCQESANKTITGDVSENITITLNPGWNLIGSVPAAITNASMLCTNISCIAAAKYENGGFRIYPAEDFSVTGTEGYFVYLTSPANWTS